MLDAILSIVVDLSEQKLYAHTNNGVKEFVVSTGKPSSPTPLMKDSIAAKYRVTDLTGRDYRVKDVPYVMCFKTHELYCIHPNTSLLPLGQPHSRGCVRMRTEDAKWMFERTEVGTAISVVE